MHFYVINYDIIEGNKRDLEKYLEELKENGLACKPLGNVWIVKTDKSQDNVYEEYRLKLKKDDRLFVSIYVIGRHKFYNIDKEAKQFMINNKLII